MSAAKEEAAYFEVWLTIKVMQKKLSLLEEARREAGAFPNHLEVTIHAFDQWVQTFGKFGS